VLSLENELASLAEAKNEEIQRGRAELGATRVLYDKTISDFNMN